MSHVDDLLKRLRGYGTDDSEAAALEIERLTRERDEWKEKWKAVIGAAIIAGGGTVNEPRR